MNYQTEKHIYKTKGEVDWNLQPFKKTIQMKNEYNKIKYQYNAENLKKDKLDNSNLPILNNRRNDFTKKKARNTTNLQNK